jgi:hypothetical protein
MHFIKQTGSPVISADMYRSQRSASAYAGRPCTPVDGSKASTQRQRPRTAHEIPTDKGVSHLL